MTPKSIEIQGRRWFARTYGNTYHTVKIWVNDEPVYVAPMQYGYDNQYAWTARQWLKEAGYLPGIQEHANGSGESLWRYCERVGCKFIDGVEDVRRQKDLHRPSAEEERQAAERVAQHRRHRYAIVIPHGLCERAGYCVEHEQNPKIEACR